MSPPPSDVSVIEAPVSTDSSARPAKPAGARRIRSGPLIVGGFSVAWLTLIVLIPNLLLVATSFMSVAGGRIKLAVSLAKGKQSHDKREAIRKREVDRETRAAMKNRHR